MAEKAPTFDKLTPKIPSLLREQLVELVEDPEFDFGTEFAVFALHELVGAHKTAANEEYSPEELERVKKRLRSFRYL